MPTNTPNQTWLSAPKGEATAPPSVHDRAIARAKASLAAGTAEDVWASIPGSEASRKQEAAAFAHAFVTSRGDWHLSTDASGHEHKGKGPGGGQFTKGGGSLFDETARPKKEKTPNHRDALKAAHAAHHAARGEFHKARKEAHAAERQGIEQAHERLTATLKSLADVNNAVDVSLSGEGGEAETAYYAMDEAAMNVAHHYETLQDKWDGLAEVEEHATSLLQASDATEENEKHAREILAHVKKARKAIKAIAGHRRAMKAIKAGEINNLALDAIRSQPLTFAASNASRQLELDRLAADFFGGKPKR